jgi:hypothetical protein
MPPRTRSNMADIINCLKQMLVRGSTRSRRQRAKAVNSAQSSTDTGHNKSRQGRLEVRPFPALRRTVTIRPIEASRLTIKSVRLTPTPAVGFWRFLDSSCTGRNDSVCANSGHSPNWRPTCNIDPTQASTEVNPEHRDGRARTFLRVIPVSVSMAAPMRYFHCGDRRRPPPRPAHARTEVRGACPR